MMRVISMHYNYNTSYFEQTRRLFKNISVLRLPLLNLIEKLLNE